MERIEMVPISKSSNYELNHGKPQNKGLFLYKKTKEIKRNLGEDGMTSDEKDGNGLRFGKAQNRTSFLFKFNLISV